MKKILLFVLVTISVSLFVYSCSITKEVSFSSSNKKENKKQVRDEEYNELVDIATIQLEDREYQLSEETLIEGLRIFENDKKLLGMLGISFFKQREFDFSSKVLNRYFELNADIYDSLNISTQKTDIYFDLFYYHIASLIELKEIDKAVNVIENRLSKVDRINLQLNNKVKLEILEIWINYSQENFLDVTNRINKLLTKYTITSELLKLNLYYLEAISYYKILDYPTSLDVIFKIIEIDKDNLYSFKLFKSLEEVVYLANSEFLEIYSENIVKCYQGILNKTKKKSIRNKILRNIYDLNNSYNSHSSSIDDLIVKGKINNKNNNFDAKVEEGISLISQISIKTDKNSTKVQFSSNDSLKYSYVYDGENLEITMKNVSLNSKKNSITPKEGSGVKSLNWKIDRKNKELIIKLSFNDSYDMEFEELFDNFEKNDNYSNKYHLVLNITLPDEELFTLNNYSVKDRLDEIGKKKKYTIIIDPGHGGDDPGAIGVKKKNNGKKYTEKEVALLLSKELKEYLENEGYRVFLTRTKDTYPTLPERNRIAESRNADMFLSIHLNSANKRNRKYWQTDRYYGSELIVRKTLGSRPKIVNSVSGSKKESKSKWLSKRKKALKEHIKLSEIFSETIPNSLHHPFNKKRSIKYKNLAIFSGLTIPHALIETGFIINNRSLEYLLSNKGQKALFKGILKGIKKYRRK